MNLFLPLLLGFTAALVGVAPPGLLNMTAAKVSAIEGRSRGIIFALGACVTVIFQTFVAVQFAKYIDRNPDVVLLLQQIGLAIFSVLTAYFFWAGKKTKKEKEFEKKSKTSRFFLGMLLSVLNLLPVPYYVFLSVWFSRKGWFKFVPANIWIFVLGTVLGSFLIFYLYILFFKRKDSDKPSFLMTNGNYIIGTVTGIISLFTLFKILNA